MSSINLGEPISFSFNCTNQLGQLFDPDVVQVSLVKDHSLEDPSASLYEDTLTYGGSEPHDSQLTKLAVGSYAVVYTSDRVGRWSCLPRWSDAGLPAGAMVTSRSPYIVDVVPTEHQFIDREAMIPPGGGEPVSVPYATSETGGMLTDLMAIKFAGIPPNAQSASQVSAIAANVATGLIESSHVLGWYLANWAVGDWYLDSVNGSDSNNGITAGTALASAEELARRLAGAIPIAHAVTVHVAQGSYGTLAVSVIQTAAACPFDVVGTPVRTPLGTVASYTDRVAAGNIASHLVIDGVSDMTPYVGRMVQITAATDPTHIGAVAWIAKANPNDGAGTPTGVATARTSRFAGVPSGAGFIPANKVVAAGSAISLVTLPAFSQIAIRQNGKQPPSGVGFFAARGLSVSNVQVADLYVDAATPGIIDACQVGQISSGALVQGTPITLVRSRLDGGAATALPLYRVQGWFVLVQRTGLTAITMQEGAYLGYSLIQGAQFAAIDAACYEVGVFDVAANDAVLIAQSRTRIANLTSLYGRDNARCGYRASQGTTLVAATGCYIIGASGAVWLNGSSAAIPTWAAALPWRDGEQSGEATLVAGTVDVTVPFVLSTQKMQVCAKTLAGTPGFLSVVYVDSTHIRITSSSATDTSVVTWHILPVGDNVVIRS